MLTGIFNIIFTFQSSTFGDLIRSVLVDAYLQVSIFVGFTLFIFIGIDSLTKFNIENFLNKTKKIHVIIATFLGALPGCGGAIIVVTQFVQGRLSFGSLVAVLTSTMGDAAFLLLSQDPLSGFQVFLIAGFTGIITGYIVDLFHNQNYLRTKKNLKIEFEKVQETFLYLSLIFFG